MVNTGPTLDLAMMNSAFTRDWEKDTILREAYFEDIGQSALNLEKLGLCHNDIRPPNITVKDGRFCLIDFDNCSAIPAFRNSPV